MHALSLPARLLAVVACPVILHIDSATAQPVNVVVKDSAQRTLATRDQLRRLLSTYDLSRWTFTRDVVIDGGFNVVPHSHPVLTLHTRHLKDDDLLLATYVHEQIHWFVPDPARADSVYRELRTMFPQVPTGHPEGARNEESTYVHLLVCYLEYQALKEMIGELRARHVMEFWANDHYTWIYRTVLARERDLGRLVRRHGLMPPRGAPRERSSARGDAL